MGSEMFKLRAIELIYTFSEDIRTSTHRNHIVQRVIN